MKAFTGIGVAMVTPFNMRGEVDVDALANLTNFLIDGGIDYLVVLGSTAEAATLWDGDQNLVIEVVMQANAGRVPIVIGAGGNDTAAVANRVEVWGEHFKPDAFLLVSPMYNRPSQEGIYQHFAKIAQRSKIPIILYNVPSRTGSNMLASTTLRLAREFKNIVGIKEASGNIEQCMEIVKGRPEGFLAISGDDILTLPKLSFGFDGVISVVGNALPKPMSEMVHAGLNGNFAEARALHFRMMDLMQLFFAEGNPTSVKVAMDLLRICRANVRLPLVEGSHELQKKMLAALKAFGLL